MINETLLGMGPIYNFDFTSVKNQIELGCSTNITDNTVVIVY